MNATSDNQIQARSGPSHLSQERRSLMINAVDVPAALQLGLQQLNARQFAEAESTFGQVLAVQPQNVNALQLLGLVMHRTGRHARAVDLLRRSVALAPKVAEIRNNLAEALRNLGQIDAAVTEYEQAILLKPEFVLARINLAHVLRTQGRLDESAEQLQRALELAPTNAEAHASLARVEQARGQIDKATALAQRAVELAPQAPAYRSVLAGVYLAHGRTAEAAEIYRDLLVQKPDEAAVWFNYASSLRLLGLVDDSLKAYRRGLVLRPDSPAGHSGLLLTLHYPDNIDPQMIFAEHAAWSTRHAPAPSPPFPAVHQATSRKIRIGYVSPDFRDHVVARFVAPLLAHHDRERFEVYCYVDQLRADGVTRQLQQHVTAWRSVAALDDEQLAAGIRADEIDILVDLAGHTADNRLLTFARRAAPVQATYLGYPDTTGLGAMDYRITDMHADPPGMTESLHTEKLVRLRCAWCFQPPAEAPEPRPRREDRAITFGCFNALPKISNATISLWCELLKTVGRARLLLKSSAFSDRTSRQRYLDQFAAHGVEANRIDLAPVTPSFADHLAMYDRIDIALDTFPYAGTTTTCEALWMGVPVVTLAGRTHVSRVGVSLLHNAGCGEWIASATADYVRIAAELANNPAHLKEFRQESRKTMRASELMDARRFALDFERACDEMQLISRSRAY